MCPPVPPLSPRSRFLKAVPLLLMGLACQALGSREVYERREFINHSKSSWTLTLVEGKRPNVGKIRFIDKFSGKETKTVEKTGDSFVLAPGSKYLIDYAQENRYFYHDFIIEDSQGNYAEFLATVPYLSNPELSLELTDKHVSSPLDRASDEEITRAIEGALRTHEGDLVIVQNFIGLSTVASF